MGLRNSLMPLLVRVRLQVSPLILVGMFVSTTHCYQQQLWPFLDFCPKLTCLLLALVGMKKHARS